MAKPDKAAFTSRGKERGPIGGKYWQRRRWVSVAAITHHFPQRFDAMLQGARGFCGIKTAAARIVMVAGGVVLHGNFQIKDALLYEA